MLMDVNGNVIDSTYTVYDGSYVFANANLGDYEIKFPTSYGMYDSTYDKFSLIDKSMESSRSISNSWANPDGYTDVIPMQDEGAASLNIDAGLQAGARDI